MYKKTEASFCEEMNLSNDLHSWANKLNDRFLCRVRQYRQVEYEVQVRCFYGFQIMMENIHFKTYSLLIDTYIKEPAQA